MWTGPRTELWTEFWAQTWTRISPSGKGHILLRSEFSMFFLEAISFNLYAAGLIHVRMEGYGDGGGGGEGGERVGTNVSLLGDGDVAM